MKVSLMLACLGAALSLLGWAGAEKAPAPESWANSTQRPLYVYLHFDKTGSSTMRQTLRGQVERPQHYRICDAPMSDDIQQCRSEDIVLSRGYGVCDNVARPCKYFVQLREPISRLISEYNYFCRNCYEKHKFCAVRSHLWSNYTPAEHCPHMPFLTWAATYNNEYTRYFSRKWDTTATEVRGGLSYYMEFLKGFPAHRAVTDADREVAYRNLAAPDMHVVWLEELKNGGWRKLDEYLGRPHMDLQSAIQTINVHPENKYEPTPIELEAARDINRLDVALHARLTGGHA